VANVKINRIMMRIPLCLAFVLVTVWTSAQETDMIENKNEVIERAKAELEKAMTPGGDLFLFGQEIGLRGSYTIDLTIRGKGEVATVFVVNGDSNDIHNQNRLKDHLKSFRFPFRMPKDRSFKFQYIFNFNPNTNN